MLNSDPVTVEITPIRRAGKEIVDQAARAVVETQEEAGRMTDLLGFVKAQLRKAEDARKALVKPLNDHVKWINDQFKAATEDLRQADEVGRFKLGQYERERARLAREEAERRRKAEEERLLAEAEALAAQGDAEEADKILEAEIPQAPKAAPTRGDFGATTVSRKVWKFRLVDKMKVPEAYLVLNEPEVRHAIRQGVREIPGLEIYEDTEIAIR